jgi:hypothetical protein
MVSSNVIAGEGFEVAAVAGLALRFAEVAIEEVVAAALDAFLEAHVRLVFVALANLALELQFFYQPFVLRAVLDLVELLAVLLEL